MTLRSWILEIIYQTGSKRSDPHEFLRILTHNAHTDYAPISHLTAEIMLGRPEKRGGGWSARATRVSHACARLRITRSSRRASRRYVFLCVRSRAPRASPGCLRTWSGSVLLFLRTEVGGRRLSAVRMCKTVRNRESRPGPWSTGSGVFVSAWQLTGSWRLPQQTALERIVDHDVARALRTRARRPAAGTWPPRQPHALHHERVLAWPGSTRSEERMEIARTQRLQDFWSVGGDFGRLRDLH